MNNNSNPKISICIPIHNMDNAAFFLKRLMESLEMQTFQDFEIVITKDGKMAENTNSAIKKAKGEIIKVLYIDDWLASPDYLFELQKAFLKPKVEWIITAALNNRFPFWTDDIETGNNKLGSPSALAFRNNFEENLLFDENLSWLLDCDLYKRLEKRFGKPAILTDICIGIGEHDGQIAQILTHEQKPREQQYLNYKYGK